MFAESTAAQDASTGAEGSMGALRFALMIGFGGMLVIFLLAAIDAIRLLHQMRAQDKILRDASVERSQRLASIRSYVLLTSTYMGDYLLDSDEPRSREDLAHLHQVWAQMLTDLGAYHSSTLEEEEALKQLHQLIEKHGEELDRAMSGQAAASARRNASFYGSEILPLRTAIVEITTRVEDVNSRQLAATEAQIQSEFEIAGRRLGTLLNLALASALLLAAGCVAYILRIEGQNRRRYQQIVRARGMLQQLSARLVDAQETERRTISRELHDQVGQTLNALLVDAANLAKRMPPEDEVSRRYLDNIRAFADSSVNSLRDIALLLRPSMLDDLGLIPALEWQAREISRRSGVKVKVVAENVPDRLTDALRTSVYRVVQEALQNVARHSGARSATVTVRQADQALLLTVEDDGSGFDPARTRGMGLVGMEERVKQLGGQLEIDSRPGKGTVLRVTLPLEVAVTG